LSRENAFARRGLDPHNYMIKCTHSYVEACMPVCMYACIRHHVCIPICLYACIQAYRNVHRNS